MKSPPTTRGPERSAAPFRRLYPAGAAGIVVLFAVAAASQAHSSSSSARHPRRVRAAVQLRLGQQALTRCGLSPLIYCGRLAVPLDHGMPTGPKITIAYRWFPATDPRIPARGTVVPVEGGPGYPSTGSVIGGYQTMYGRLLRRWNLLAVDNRGTGDSTPLYCSLLQNFSGPTASRRFARAVTVCAAALNHRWRYPNGSWVHASDMFKSAPAAEDLASVIHALGIAKVDVYGDSYGSYFAQVFAARFPRLVRSVTLDSTYPTKDLNPWYSTTIHAMPAAFDDVCRRSAACAGAAPGSSWRRLVKLTRLLARHSIAADVPDETGALAHVRMNVVGLVNLLNDAAADPEIYREIDAAARAFLDHHDPAPLLRLNALRRGSDEAYFGQPVSSYSVELYLAVSCLDYPQLFDLKLPPGRRVAEFKRAQAALPRGTFSPFTTEEWLAQDQNTETYSSCLQWPSPAAAQPAAVAAPRLPKSIRVLVLGGQLDTWTPASGASRVRSQIGGTSRFIELANATHVVGEGNTTCASILVQRFVATPEAIGSLRDNCARGVPPIHSVGVYPDRLSAEPPLHPSSGSTDSRTALRLAASAVSTAGDAVARLQAITSCVDHGLHGGTVTSPGDCSSSLTLHGDQLVPGVPVTGTVTVTGAAGKSRGQSATARVTINAPGLPKASFTATWSSGGAHARATVSGTVDGQRVAGTMPAP